VRSFPTKYIKGGDKKCGISLRAVSDHQSRGGVILLNSINCYKAVSESNARDQRTLTPEGEIGLKPEKSEKESLRGGGGADVNVARKARCDKRCTGGGKGGKLEREVVRAAGKRLLRVTSASEKGGAGRAREMWLLRRSPG